MRLDQELILCEDQAVTTSAASTNYIDQGAAGDAYSSMFIQCLVSEAVTSAGAANVNFKVETDDNTSFSSSTVLFETGNIAKATLVDKYTPFKLRIPFGTQRYIRVYFTCSATLTAGQFTVFICKDVMLDQKQYS